MKKSWKLSDLVAYHTPPAKLRPDRRKTLRTKLRNRCFGSLGGGESGNILVVEVLGGGVAVPENICGLSDGGGGVRGMLTGEMVFEVMRLGPLDGRSGTGGIGPLAV